MNAKTVDAKTLHRQFHEETVRLEAAMRIIDVKQMRHAQKSGTAPAVFVVGVVQAHATRIIQWLNVQVEMKGAKMVEPYQLAELIIELANQLIADASKELPAKPRPPPTSAPSSGTEVTP